MVGVRGGHYLSPSEYVKHGSCPTTQPSEVGGCGVRRQSASCFLSDLSL